jgi:hypothetical protein
MYQQYMVMEVDTVLASTVGIRCDFFASIFATLYGGNSLIRTEHQH